MIISALTAGMSGFGLHTCDAGGYTTLYGLHRDEELLLRWLELPASHPSCARTRATVRTTMFNFIQAVK